MNESALEGFVKIVEMNSFSAAQTHCIFRSQHFHSRYVLWKVN